MLARSDWFLAFLAMFPIPAMITALGKEAFTAAAWAVVGRKVAKRRLLSDIYETAQASIGLPVEPSSDAVAIKGEIGHGLLQRGRFAAQLLTSGLVACRAVSPARRRLPASRNSFDQL